MKLLLDQDVYAATAAYLRHLGHDVKKASDIGLAAAPDEILLKAAFTVVERNGYRHRRVVRRAEGAEDIS